MFCLLLSTFSFSSNFIALCLHFFFIVPHHFVGDLSRTFFYSLVSINILSKYLINHPFVHEFPEILSSLSFHIVVILQ